MTGKKIIQANCGDWFLPEAFMSCFKNARGKKNSFDKATLKRANRTFRHNKDYKNDIDE